MALSATCVICTYKRPRLLTAAVQSVLAQTLPTSDYEVVVVDNGDDHDTRQAIEALAAPNLRLLTEPILGLTRARNLGIAEARGDLIAFLDDDAAAEPDWLGNLVAAYRGLEGRHAVIGGPVRPAWEAQPPKWLRGHLLTFLTVLDYGDSSQECRLPEEPLYGCNMAVPRATFEAVGGFSARLGRAGSRLMSSDDVELQLRVRAAGGVIVYEPKAAVRHHIPASRLTARWFLRRLFAQGVSDAIMRRELARGDAASGPYLPPLGARIGRAARTPSPMLGALGLAYVAGAVYGTAKRARSPTAV